MCLKIAKWDFRMLINVEQVSRSIASESDGLCASFIIDQEILLQLETAGVLTFTPSRYVGSGIGRKRLVCYDDRYVIKLAVETDGIIVSNDTYRDLVQENPDYRKAIEERLLMFSFVNDR